VRLAVSNGIGLSIGHAGPVRLTEAAGEPKYRQRLDAMLLIEGSCMSRQNSCHEEEGGEEKGMTG